MSIRNSILAAVVATSVIAVPTVAQAAPSAASLSLVKRQGAKIAVGSNLEGVSTPLIVLGVVVVGTGLYFAVRKKSK